MSLDRTTAGNVLITSIYVGIDKEKIIGDFPGVESKGRLILAMGKIR